MLITIWTTCRSWKRGKRFEIIARNAVKSWTLLEPRPEVLLIGNEEGTAELAKWAGCKHIPDVEYNEWGTPLMGSLFKTAARHATNDVLALVSDDIILFHDFMDATKEVSLNFGEFLMVGVKWQLGYEAPVLDFSEGWQSKILGLAHKHGESHSAAGGSDYFVYPTGMYDVKWPPICRGKYRDDLWIMGNARVRGIPLVDATKAITALHQPHPKDARAGPEVRRNIELVRKPNRAIPKEAKWFLDKWGKLCKR